MLELISLSFHLTRQEGRNEVDRHPYVYRVALVLAGLGHADEREHVEIIPAPNDWAAATKFDEPVLGGDLRSGGRTLRLTLQVSLLAQLAHLLSHVIFGTVG